MEMSLLHRIFENGRVKQVILVGTTILFSVGMIGCSTFNPSETITQGYVLDQKALDSVPVGSSREQVILALGSPSTTATFDNEVFYYITQKRYRAVQFITPKTIDRRILAVYFNDDGQVTKIGHYGLQDGKVFDFISRTTPTGGKDQTFLGQLMASAKAPISNLPTTTR